MFFGSYDPAFLTNKVDLRKALLLGYDKKAIVGKIYPPAVAASRPARRRSIRSASDGIRASAGLSLPTPGGEATG